MDDRLLPTPNASNLNDGQTEESWRTRRKRERAKGYNGNGGATPLAMAVPLIAKGIDPNDGDLLPTPTAGDGKSSGSRNLEGSTAHDGVSLTDAILHGNSNTPRRTSASSPGSEGSTSPRKRSAPFGPWFWSQVEPRWTEAQVPEPCWEWRAGRASDGYGAVSYKGRQHKAHRIAWVLATGEVIPKGRYLCHRCDNPPCVNPEHLYVGTNQENQRDAVERGQHNPTRGEAHGMAQLTLAQVQEIRRLFAEGANQRELADRFGTTLGNVHLIVRGKKWKSDPLLPTPRFEGFDAGNHRGQPDGLNQTVRHISPSSAEWEVSISRLRLMVSGQSDRSSGTPPAPESSSDGGRLFPDGETSPGSALLPTPQAQDAKQNGTREQSRDLMLHQALTSSSVASPVSPSPPPDGARPRTTTAGSGPSSPVALASLNPDGSWSRTYRDFSTQESLWDQPSAASSPTWPTSGMTRRGRAYALPMSARAIDDSGSSSSLRTPTAAETHNQDFSAQTYLQNQVKHLHMPTGSDTNPSYDHRASSGYTRAKPVPNLAAQVDELLPTPTAQEGSGKDRDWYGDIAMHLNRLSLGDHTPPPSDDGSGS